MTRIETEFPFLWDQFPINEIQLAGQRQRDFLQQKGANDAAIAMIIEKTYTRLGEAVHAFGGGVKTWLVEYKLPPEVNMSELLLRNIIQNWYQELIRTRSNDDWPTFGGSRLKRWALSNACYFMPNEPEIDRRNAVVYLPSFMALVAAGRVNFADVFENSADATFFLRLVRDFDSNWFHSVYRFTLLNALKSEHEGAV